MALTLIWIDIQFHKLYQNKLNIFHIKKREYKTKWGKNAAKFRHVYYSMIIIQ